MADIIKNLQAQYMNKSIPKNPKYQDVKCKVDTGHSVPKYKEKREELEKHAKYREDEQFKRIKATTFAQVVLHVALTSDLSCETDDEESPKSLENAAKLGNNTLQETPVSKDQEPSQNVMNCKPSRQTLINLMSGVEEMSLKVKRKKGENDAEQPYSDCPYLLLDVRDRDAYERCHIITAHSYPLFMLSQTSPFTKDVFDYRSKPGKIIIVYDEDETIAREAATRLTKTDSQNVFMLTGGLRMVAEKFPEGLTTGSIPASCLSSPTPFKQQRSLADIRWRFTPEELCTIQEQLQRMDIQLNPAKFEGPLDAACQILFDKDERRRKQLSGLLFDSSHLQPKRVPSHRPPWRV